MSANGLVHLRGEWSLRFSFHLHVTNTAPMSFFKLKPIVALSAVLLTVGCNKTEMTSSAQEGSRMKIRVGYIGITCEAPIFCAVENGFFKEEGLDVELVKCEWSKYKDVLALGGFDITHHLIMYLLKPIEQGLDVKFTAGIHRGCLRIQSATHRRRS
jgi:NitT/TauT family transport system substrate-binding protein